MPVKLAVSLLAAFSALPARAIKIERLPVSALPSVSLSSAAPLAVQGAKSSTGKPQAPAFIEVAAGMALVRFAKSTPEAQRLSSLQAAGAKKIGELSPIGWTVVNLAPGQSVADGLAALKALPGVEEVSPNHVYRPHKTSNDPLVDSQYALSQIDAFGGWEYETDPGHTVTVAVIDTGIDGSHPDLKDKLTTGKDMFFDPSTGAQTGVDVATVAACYHGTVVAGIAAASSNNGIDIAGVSWGAKLLSLKVYADSDCTDVNCSGGCCDQGSGCATSEVAISSALIYAAGLGIGQIVANISSGQAGASCSAAYAIAVATAAGIPVAIAAGNSGGSLDDPANCAGTAGGTGIVPVAATDQNNAIASFSAKGPELAANGIAAPGVDILSTTTSTMSATGTSPDNSGTSFASPHAAGLMALVLAAEPTCGGTGNCAAYAQAALRNSADNIGYSSDQQGMGRINAFKALRYASGALSSFAGDRVPISFPNPFRIAESPQVSFSIPPSLAGSDSTIKIYTIDGELVATLTSLSWDGRNSSGNPVASGTYIFIVQTSNGSARGRMAVIR